jgi:hypothetical protein
MSTHLGDSFDYVFTHCNILNNFTWEIVIIIFIIINFIIIFLKLWNGVQSQ